MMVKLRFHHIIYSVHNCFLTELLLSSQVIDHSQEGGGGGASGGVIMWHLVQQSSMRIQRYNLFSNLQLEFHHYYVLTKGC